MRSIPKRSNDKYSTKPNVFSSIASDIFSLISWKTVSCTSHYFLILYRKRMYKFLNGSISCKKTWCTFVCSVHSSLRITTPAWIQKKICNFQYLNELSLCDRLWRHRNELRMWKIEYSIPLPPFAASLRYVHMNTSPMSAKTAYFKRIKEKIPLAIFWIHCKANNASSCVTDSVYKLHDARRSCCELY